MKLMITNVVYGSTFAELFLEYHLPSLLDESNLPKIKHQIEKITIYTDVETLPVLKKHPRMMELLSLCEVDIMDFTWRPGANRFDMRYSLLINTFRQGADEALKRGSLLAAWTADMLIAKGALPKLIEKMDDGFDAVFLHPARAAAEASVPAIKESGASLYPHDLWKLVAEHPHPYLWVANHFRGVNFTKNPFYILWSTHTGALMRTFSITPIIMRPTEGMKEVTQVIDIEVPEMFEHPYWAEDFDEFGIAQIEPTLAYNQTYTGMPASIPHLQNFAKGRHEHQRDTFDRKFWFPNRLVAGVDIETMHESDRVVDEVLRGNEKA